MTARLIPVEGGLAPIEVAERGLIAGAGGVDAAVDVVVEGWPPRALQIVLDDDGFRAVDLAGDGFVTVNGEPASNVPLHDGDEVAIGGVVYRFEDEEASDPMALLEEDLALIYEESGEAGVAEAYDALYEFVVRRTLTQLRKRLESSQNLQRLQAAAKALASERDRKKLLSRILDEAIAFARAERGFLLVDDPEGGFSVEVARNFDREAVPRPILKVSRSVSEQVRRSGEPIVLTNAQEDERFTSNMSIAALRLRSIACVPLKMSGRTVGSIYLDNRFEHGTFTADDLPLLQSFADHAAIALENARLIEENVVRAKELERSKLRVEELNRILEDKLERQKTELQEVRQILRERQSGDELRYTYENIVGRSPRMREVLAILDRVIDGEFAVLIQGESGTGKELVARAIHHNGPRRRGPFVSENCAAIPDTLLESELFGHAKGAFTGADRARKGLVELASGGTLFLDEIGDMTLEMQKKLLRVLEQHEVRPVGAKEVIPVDVRVISASNRPLREMAERGDFRPDLLYRLNVVTVEMPPLRERVDDIPLLVDHFLDAAAAEDAGTERKEIDDDALAMLMGYDWPGNVRELKNEIQRACALSDRIILPEILSDGVRSAIGPRVIPGRFVDRGLKEITAEATASLERRILIDALRRNQWKKSVTARQLRISRPTLDAKIQRYGLTREGDGG